MDTLGHDIQNNNQAVLSYLELILSDPKLDPKTKGYAMRAISHVRTSTVLLEDIRKMVLAKHLDPRSMRVVDIVPAAAEAAKELSDYFPGRRISAEFSSKAKSAKAIGNSLAKDLVLNMLINLVTLDRSESVRVAVRIEDSGDSWSISGENKQAELLPLLRKGDIDTIYQEDVSVSSRLSGILFTKLLCDALGGGFQARGSGTKDRGVVLTITLRKAGIQ